MITIKLPRFLFIAALASWLSLLAFFIDSSFSAEPLVPRGEGRRVSARIQLPKHRFDDVASDVGVPVEITPTWGSNWADMNADGFPELLVNRHKRAPWVLLNTSGSFSPLEDDELVELPEGRTYYDRHTCSWGEADENGTPDLLCVAGAQKGEGEGPNKLLLWDGAGFTDQAGRYGVVDALGRGRTVNWFDFDSDGDLDVFVGNEVRSGHPSMLYRNDGGTFSEVDSVVGREFATTDSTWADADSDGDPDLLVLGHGEEGAIFYRNDSGTFIEADLPGVSGQGWLSGAWDDFDGDGYIDLVLVDAQRAVIWRSQNGNFYEWQEISLSSGRSGAWLDADNDGDLDLYLVQGSERGTSLSAENEPDVLFINDGRQFTQWTQPGPEGYEIGSGDSVSVSDFDRDGRVDIFVTNGHLTARGPSSLIRNTMNVANWAGLRIEGDDANPFGYGARVRVVTSQGAYWRFLTDEMSFHAQSEVGYLHMGLGAAESARVRFRWPDGTDDCFSVEAGSISVAAKGTAGCS